MLRLKLPNRIIGIALHPIIKRHIISLQLLIILLRNINALEELVHPLSERLVEMRLVLVVRGEDFQGHFGVEGEKVRVRDG